MADIFIYVVDLPEKTHEMITPCADGNYTVYLNGRLSDVAQKKAFQHAVRHIENCDFEKYNVQEIEARCHEDY